MPCNPIHGKTWDIFSTIVRHSVRFHSVKWYDFDIHINGIHHFVHHWSPWQWQYRLCIDKQNIKWYIDYEGHTRAHKTRIANGGTQHAFNNVPERFFSFSLLPLNTPRFLRRDFVKTGCENDHHTVGNLWVGHPQDNTPIFNASTPSANDPESICIVDSFANVRGKCRRPQALMGVQHGTNR